MDLSTALMMCSVMCSMVLIPVVLGTLLKAAFGDDEENSCGLDGERHTLP